MIYRESADGVRSIECEDTQSLSNIQDEKKQALTLNPTLDINPCSAVPLTELLNSSTTNSE